MYPRWVLHLIDAVIVFFTVDIISSVGIMATPLSFIQQYQSYVFHTIALRFFHILHHDIGTNAVSYTHLDVYKRQMYSGGI